MMASDSSSVPQAVGTASKAGGAVQLVAAASGTGSGGGGGGYQSQQESLQILQVARGTLCWYSLACVGGRELGTM